MATVTVERFPALRNAALQPDADGLVDTGYSEDCAALDRMGTETGISSLQGQAGARQA